MPPLNEFRPFVEYFDAAHAGDMPSEMMRSIEPIEIALSPLAGETPYFRVISAWTADWWFTMIDGNGIAQARGDRAQQAGQYVVLVQSLSGKNRPSGTLGSLPRVGEMLLLPWRPNGGVISAGQFRYLFVFIPKAALFEIVPPGSELPFGRRVSTIAGSGAILASLLRTMVNETSRSPSRADAANALPALARLIVDVFSKAEPVDLDRTTHRDRLDRVKAYLNDHLSLQGMSAQHVADGCGMSKRQLFRTFASAGSNFSETLWDMRIERAREMLAFRPDLSIAEVARSTGFSSSSHLGRMFRSALGVSPGGFRASNAPSRDP